MNEQYDWGGFYDSLCENAPRLLECEPGLKEFIVAEAEASPPTNED